MSEFKIIDEKRYPINIYNKDLLPYHRWEHRVTLGYRGRSIMVFLDNLTGTVYIEEILAAGLKFIEDNSLVMAVQIYTQNKGFLNLLSPLMKEQ